MRVAATTLLLCLLLAGQAHAATVSVSGSTLRVDAAPGEANQLAVGPTSGVVTVTDAGAALTAGDGSTAAGPAVECASAALLSAVVELGDGADTFISSASLPLVVTDGDGADRVTGGPAADLFLASPGADVYAGGGGSDGVTYASRADPVAVDVDNAADDGAAGEGDDAR